MADEITPHALPPIRKRRPYWRKAFLEHLAESSNVKRAAAFAGVSTSQVYKARREESDFAHAWAAALLDGYCHLEFEVLRRLRDGDQLTDDSGKYDFANAIRFLNAHRENVNQNQAQLAEVSVAEFRSAIDRKVEELKLKLSREELQSKGKG